MNWRGSRPAEVLVSDEQKQQFADIAGVLAYDSYAFLPEQAIFTLCEHFKVKSLDGFGCAQMPQAVAAAGAIVHYLKQQLRRKIDHLTSLRCDAPDHYVVLDAATQTNLELVESRGARDTSLLAALDRTVTPMGGRKLRGWILQPLRDLTELECRQQMIADLLQESDLLGSLRASLKSIRDMERAAGRLSQASGNARDLVALKTSLQQIPKLKGELAKLIERIEFGRARPVRAGLATGPPDSVEQACRLQILRWSRRHACATAMFAKRNPRDAGACGKTDARSGGRPALGAERRRNFPRRIQRRSGRTASGVARRKKLDHRITGARDRRDRDQVAQGAFQLGLRLFHRDHEIESGERAHRITRASKRP